MSDDTFLNTMTQICTFLAGIFFTCLLLLVQIKEKFPYSITIMHFQGKIPLEILATLVTLTFISFAFGALSFASSYGRNPSEMKKIMELAANFNSVGFATMFFSLFFLLLLVDFWVALLGILISVCMFAYFVKRTY